MSTVINHLGKKFGRLTVLSRAPNRGRYAVWNCRCDCGTVKEVRATSLTMGTTSSCGCLQKERVTRHGLTQSPEYRTWAGMKERCSSPKSISWKNYGARGISVYEGWHNNFMAFYRHIGPRPSDQYSIERINNDGNYEPGNVKWATRLEQVANTRERVLRQVCAQGHNNWYQVPGIRGRRCRTCNNEASRRYHERKAKGQNNV